MATKLINNIDWEQKILQVDIFVVFKACTCMHVSAIMFNIWALKSKCNECFSLAFTFKGMRSNYFQWHAMTRQITQSMQENRTLMMNEKEKWGEDPERGWLPDIWRVSLWSAPVARDCSDDQAWRRQRERERAQTTNTILSRRPRAFLWFTPSPCEREKSRHLASSLF